MHIPSFRSLWQSLIFFCLLFLAYQCSITFFFPRIEYSSHNSSLQYPHLSGPENSVSEASFTLTLQSFSPRTFFIRADDCLEGLTINAIDVPVASDCPRFQTLHLSSLLHDGDNVLHARIRNFSGPLSIEFFPSLFDVSTFCFHLFFFLLLGIISLYSYPLFLNIFSDKRIVLFFFIGAVVQLFYVLNTHFSIRAYDVDGHLTYVWHVLHHWTIPPYNSSWQAYQPPLYYFLSALFLLPSFLLGAQEPLLILFLQLFSFLLILIGFFVYYFTLFEIFPLQSQLWIRRLSALFLSFFPGVFFFSSRPSNDVLLFLCSSLFLFFLLRFLRFYRKKDWVLTLLILICALLTKANAFAFIAVAFSILFFVCKRNNHYQFFQFFIPSLLALLFFVGWYYVFRFFFEGQTHIVGNIAGNTPNLFTPNWKPANLFLFHPLEFFRMPYFNAFDDSTGRPYLFEVILKSAITGEWNFGAIGIVVLRIFYSITLPILFCGICLAAHRLIIDPYRDATLFLLALLTFCILSSMMLLVMNKHNGGLQNFRYTPILIIPTLFFVGSFYDLFSAKKSIQKALQLLSSIAICMLVILYGIILRSM